MDHYDFQTGTVVPGFLKRYWASLRRTLLLSHFWQPGKSRLSVLLRVSQIAFNDSYPRFRVLGYRPAAKECDATGDDNSNAVCCKIISFI